MKFFKIFREAAKSDYYKIRHVCVSVCLSVFPPARKDSALQIDRFFMKCDIRNFFFRKAVEKIQVAPRNFLTIERLVTHH